MVLNARDIFPSVPRLTDPGRRESAVVYFSILGKPGKLDILDNMRADCDVFSAVLFVALDFLNFVSECLHPHEYFIYSFIQSWGRCHSYFSTSKWGRMVKETSLSLFLFIVLGITWSGV